MYLRAMIADFVEKIYSENAPQYTVDVKIDLIRSCLDYLKTNNCNNLRNRIFNLLNSRSEFDELFLTRVYNEITLLEYQTLFTERQQGNTCMCLMWSHTFKKVYFRKPIFTDSTNINVLHTSGQICTELCTPDIFLLFCEQNTSIHKIR